MSKMKGETLQKPPPLLLPPAKHRSGTLQSHKEKSLEERAVYKFTARYDAFHGILKRVSEMKLNGSLDSEERSTGSEKSESSQSKRRLRSGSSSMDDHSNVSAFEDESSVSSITGSDNSPPYEEIPRVRHSRHSSYSCASLPSYPEYSESNLSSFRESFPPPPSPIEIHKNLQNGQSKEYKKEKRESFQEPRLNPTSDAVHPPELDDSCHKLYERGISLEGRHPEGIAESEKHQLEIFFKSLRTDVYVCGSLANMYVGWKEGEGNWSFKHTGVVVVIFDSGDTRSRNKRKIQIVLAERGTCFPLWKDTIDNLSAYHKSGTAFHVMYLSSDHRQMIGFSFDSPSESDKLIKHLENLTSNPENINISVPGSRKKSKKTTTKKPPPLPHKKHISNPCLFQHVTSVAARDKPIYMSLQTLIDIDVVKKENIS